MRGLGYDARMSKRVSRREALQHMGTAGAGLLLGGGVIRGQSAPIVIAGKPVEIVVAGVSRSTVRITVLPLDGGTAVPVRDDNALVAAAEGKPLARTRQRF